MLGRLNEALAERNGSGSFCTVAYAVVEPRPGTTRVQLALGGHPRPLLMRAGGGVEPLGQPGTMLGVDPGVRVPDAEAELLAGDALVLFTDGVIECKTPDGRFGFEQLGALLGRVEASDAAGITRAVLDATVSAPANSSNDDVAVLVLRALE